MPVDRHDAQPGSAQQHSVADVLAQGVGREPDLPDQDSGHSQGLAPGFGLPPDIGGAVADSVLLLDPADAELQEEIHDHGRDGERPPHELGQHQHGGAVDDLVQQGIHEHAVVGDPFEVHDLPPGQRGFLTRRQHATLPAGDLTVENVQHHTDAEADTSGQVLIRCEEVDHRRPPEDPEVGDPVGRGEQVGNRTVHDTSSTVAIYTYHIILNISRNSFK